MTKVLTSIADWISWLPAVSRIECIDNIGFPTSTVLTPIFDSMAGSKLVNNF